MASQREQTPEAAQRARELAELIAGRRLLVASNRGPVEFVREGNGRLSTKRGSGGVVTALASVASAVPLTWVAAAMTEGDRAAFPDASATAREVRLGRQALRVRYVNIPPETYALHYDTISNELLWFLQHYLWDPIRAPNFTEKEYTAWNQGYRLVNEELARAVAEEALAPHGGGRAARGQAADGSQALILLQDYHLYLAAGFVRARLPRAIIEQFVHIPWPAPRYWEFLPERFVSDIFTGLAANDLLGFQTEADARNFLECARAFLPGSRVDLDQGRLVWRRQRLLARAYPITVDADEVAKAMRSAAGRQGERELAPLLGDDMQVIVRVDRLEPTKNIVRGFLAYELLLQAHPELRGRVRMLAFLVPSRQSLPAYQQYDREVRRLIRRINTTYGSTGSTGAERWQPITAFFENNRARALVALRRADVILVNPLIDGMNLVAKESALANAHDGALLLSRTAGAFVELGEVALPLTPTDLEETAETLYEALTMSEGERQRRAARAREIVAATSLERWALDQIRDAVQAHGRPRAAEHPHTLQRVG